MKQPKKPTIEGLKKTIADIPAMVENLENTIAKMYQLKLSSLQEISRMSPDFYLARIKYKDGAKIMMEYLQTYRKAYPEKADPNWYHIEDKEYSFENFWIQQRTIWNKAHDLKWNQNRSPNGRLMEYKRRSSR